ncbi:acyl-CoA thioesterase [Klenkia brasiliensis]|uniref:Acyl-CoA thioesterase-2 n=1 Tax=Klenkia brasiliensis TaxID=333142 RepID=A0A1G8A5C9_9ACTN|nr:acyl-CoA thioesterase domain-containing protein [Klenkia brasiliensis]SDH16138.1 acyl-CoA thioesterase-2 [Klenkia brasiliensis]
MSHDVADLLGVLDLAPAGEDRFCGGSAALALPQLFGGQLLAQAVVAAGRTVRPDRSTVSLHASFLRPGRSGVPLDLAVERVRDGRLLSTREVRIRQGGAEVCRVVTTAAVDGEGPGHAPPLPDVRPAAELPDLAAASAPHGGLGPVWAGFDAVEVRLPALPPGGVPPEPPGPGVVGVGGGTSTAWMRAAGPLPDDPLLHRAVLAYLSDLLLISAAVQPHGYHLGHERAFDEQWSAVSLDHAMWWHTRPRGDEWLLFELASPASVGGRALVTAQVWAQDGTPVAGVAQQALVLPRIPSPA